MYRSPALRKLAPSRQAELLEQATTSINSKRSVLFACCGLALLCVAPLWLLGSYLGGWYSMVVFLSFAPAFVWHAHLVRLELVALLHGPSVGKWVDQRSNPSIERTSQRLLRARCAAARIEPWDPMRAIAMSCGGSLVGCPPDGDCVRCPLS